MTTSPRLIDSSNRPFALDRQLASGGEGAVYLLPNDTSRVAKVYHQPPTPQTTDKLIAMVGLKNDELLKVAAWPTALLFTRYPRRVAGFIMARLSDCQPVQHLYNPVMRLKHYPQASWSFQVRAALNMAAAFDEVHKAGCLVGDVNQSNALVSSQALVRLIDCDSFQVQANGRQYLCEVGVPHYTPPELQGKSFRGLVRTENHDRFGLAVFVYQLLFVGRHPYAGVFQGKGDPSFEDLIAQFRFAQGPGAASSQMKPPPHTPTFDDIPPDLGNLFRRAFEKGSEAGSRPKPSEWMVALKELERNITECPVDPGHRHWRGQSRCVWCRLADAGGPEYYFGVGGGSGSFALDEKRLQEVLRRLAAVKEVGPAPTRAGYRRGIVVAGRALPGKAQELKDAWGAAVVVAQGVVAEQLRIEAQEIKLAEEKEGRRFTELDEQIKLAEAQEGRRSAELSKKIERAKTENGRRVDELDKEYQIAEAEWDEEYDETRAAASAQWKDKQRITVVLGVTTALCALVLLIGLITSGTIALIGGLGVVVFGVWMVAHVAILSFSGPSHHLIELRQQWKRTQRQFDQRRAELRQEWMRTEDAFDQRRAELRHEWVRTQKEFGQQRRGITDRTEDARRIAHSNTHQARRKAEERVAAAEQVYLDYIATELREREHRHREAERILTELEHVLNERAAEARRWQQRIRTDIATAATNCRELATRYQVELRQVQQSAEAVARIRHLRMHLVDDADISGIGEKRKRTLIANRVVTAADVTWDVIRDISGFGDSLTQKVVDWRQSVERAFSFNPNVVANSAEQRTLVQRYRTRQSQLFAEIDQFLTELESRTETTNSDIEPLLRRAVAEWERTEADLRVAKTPI